MFSSDPCCLLAHSYISICAHASRQLRLLSRSSEFIPKDRCRQCVIRSHAHLLACLSHSCSLSLSSCFLSRLCQSTVAAHIGTSPFSGRTFLLLAPSRTLQSASFRRCTSCCFLHKCNPMQRNRQNAMSDTAAPVQGCRATYAHSHTLDHQGI